MRNKKKKKEKWHADCLVIVGSEREWKRVLRVGGEADKCSVKK